MQELAGALASVRAPALLWHAWRERFVGLLEMLFGAPEAMPRRPQRPAPIEVSCQPLCVYAPVTGETMPTGEIPDPIFASGAMGHVIGIKPFASVVRAPVTGTVALTTGTLHAIGLRSDDGLEILIHLGVDTVNLLGEAFVGYVRQGERVHAGEALIEMDLSRIAAAGCSDVVIMALTNTSEFEVAESLPQGHGRVVAGERVMSCKAKEA